MLFIKYQYVNSGWANRLVTHYEGQNRKPGFLSQLRLIIWTILISVSVKLEYDVEHNCAGLVEEKLQENELVDVTSPSRTRMSDPKWLHHLQLYRWMNFWKQKNMFFLSLVFQLHIKNWTFCFCFEIICK